MPAKTEPYVRDLRRLLAEALDTGVAAPLETYLAERSRLPGPRGNLELIAAFATVVGDHVAPPGPLDTTALEALLDGWAALPLAAAPVNDPREIWPAAAIRAYGRVAVVRPDWWDDEIAKLHGGAGNPRWRTREMVATALQDLLAADWHRTYAVLTTWLADRDPLVVRAAAAAIAEPPLLRDPARGAEAVAIQAAATAWLGRVPAERRREPEMMVLRQALGYTLSVAAAAAPQAGFALLETLAARADRDLQWVVRENLKKHRLQPWAAQAAAIQARLAIGNGRHA